MLRVINKTPGQTCFLCESKDTALVKGASFSLVLCKEHAWKKGPDATKKEDSNATGAAQSERRGSAAQAV